MPFCHHMFLITFDMEYGLFIGGIRHCRNHPAGPVEIVRRHFCCRIGEIVWCSRHFCIEWHKHIKRIGRKRYPLQNTRIRRLIRAHLNHRKKIIAVNTDGTERSLFRLIAISSIWIVRRSLIVGRQHILHILHGHFFLRDHAPRQIIRVRSVIRVCSVPFPSVWIQATLHIPCTRRIIDMVCIVVASKGIPGIQFAVHRQIQMILLNKFPHIC